MPFFPVLRSDQYPATSDTQCISVIIPDGDEYKALLVGLLSIAAYPDSYDFPDSAQVEGLSSVWDDAFSQTDFEGCPLIMMNWFYRDLWLGDFAVLAGNANNVWQSFALQEFNGAFAQAPAAINDYRNMDFDCPEGKYTVEVHYLKASVSGKFTLSFDGGVLGTTTDMYAAANTYNQKVTFTNVSVVGDGSHSVALQILSKNASSTGYSAYITRVRVIRTGRS